ncbi:hypothetical protein HRbin17_00533 [bacterium HR17]|uniref:PEP-CTERM protein-sorting domain-containing protein n=1 Tax=Candidatus Fervidibacter japonicus TaxID=2035412 RepID=A0A2H5XA21_9BACT|nr:hypothetical protein HRbin17_00533 [bacterium HR17]
MAARLRAAFIALLALLSAMPLHAIPTLQLYIEGATYDPATESWRIVTGGELKLWVIGNVGRYGTIHDVRLAAAVKADETGTITIEPSTATPGLLPSPGDPSFPPSPTLTDNFPSPPGALPLLGDGSPLPKHDAYGPNVRFYEWNLGNFTLTDSPIGDFTNQFPTNFPQRGQINAYLITISGFPSGVHFDAYNHVQGKNSGRFKYRFAPFSHDAVWHTPEPAAGLLVVVGTLAALVRRNWVRRKMSA